MIADRIGDTVETTLKTYSHLYLDKQVQLFNKLEEMNNSTILVPINNLHKVNRLFIVLSGINKIVKINRKNIFFRAIFIYRIQLLIKFKESFTYKSRINSCFISHFHVKSTKHGLVF